MEADDFGISKKPSPSSLRRRRNQPIQGSNSEARVGLPKESGSSGNLPSRDSNIIIMGWLFKYSKSPFGHRWSKRYFVLEQKALCYYKSLPVPKQNPSKRIALHSSSRVEDAGRMTSNGKEMFAFKLHFKVGKAFVMGTRHPEFAAAWIESLQRTIANVMDRKWNESDEAAITSAMERLGNLGHISGSDDETDSAGTPLLRSFSMSEMDQLRPRDDRKPVTPAAESSLDGDDASNADGVDEDDEDEVMTKGNGLSQYRRMGPGPPSEFGEIFEAMEALRTAESLAVDGSWRLIKLENGLRYFEEVSESPGSRNKCSSVQCMSAVGTVDASSDSIFRLVMDLGPTRYEWDPAYKAAAVLSIHDGHTDCIYYATNPLPAGGLLSLVPWASRELFVRRYWQRDHDGSYIVLYQSTHEDLESDPHLLEAKARARGKAAIRATLNHGAFIISPAGKDRSVVMHILELDAGGWGSGLGCLGVSSDIQMHLLSRVAGIREFFSQTRSRGIRPLTLRIPKSQVLSDSTPNLVSPASRTDLASVTSMPTGQVAMSPHGSMLSSSSMSWNWAVDVGSLKKGPIRGGDNCWSEAPAHLFPVRSSSYLADKRKVPAGPPQLRLVAVDWLKRSERIDHIVALRTTPVHESVQPSSLSERPFFFVVNMQVPAAVSYSMVFYWASPSPPKPGSLLHKFCEGDDAFRNPRFKLIPRIAQGAWVVKRSVGTTPLIIPGALTVAYHKGPNYFECDVDIGSSSVANGIVRFVLGYVTSLVIDMAFLIQSNSEDELPESLLGTIRISQLQPSAAVDLDNEKKSD